MAESSNYPRERPEVRKRHPMELVDRVVAGVIAAFVGTVFLGAMVLDRTFGYAILLGIGLVPAVLLLIPRVSSMLLVMLTGLPCCLGASMFCDGSNLPGFTSTVLHRGHDWVFLIGLYGFARACQLGGLRRRGKD